MSRNVIFVAPYLMPQTVRFLDAVKRLEDVRLFGICQKQDNADPVLFSRFAAIEWVDDIFSVDQIEAAARRIEAAHGKLHRLLSILELIQLTVAKARARLGLPGLSPETAEVFLDKTVMKDKLRSLGLPCARHALIRNEEEAKAFAAEVGYPVVLKPPVGAACKSTYYITNGFELTNAIAESRPSAEKPAQVEEFIVGDEYSFDTVVVDGKVRFHSINRYFPTPLEVMRNPWIQWVYVSPLDISGHNFDDVRKVGIEAVEKMGMQFGITHMEWFRRRDGTIAIGEIAARPPGAQIVPAMSHAHEVDFFRVWARAVVDGAFDGPFERKWAVGTAFLRGQGTGRVSRVEGVDAVKHRFGHLIAEEYIPMIGAPAAETYEGDGYFLLKAKDTDTVYRALMDIVSAVRVYYT